jgi:serine phosphatase RsbU (regulator of sigma subunit)
LPLVGLQWLLARERRQRLDTSLALNEEHRIAVALQRGLLPKRLPEVPGIDLAAHYEAAGGASEAGGDWYDAFALPEGRIGLVVGDVTGSGIAAAATMGQLRSVTRAFALADGATSAPGEVLTRLNRYQRATGEGSVFSVVYAVVDPARRTVWWASAGHPPPLLRAASGDTHLLRGGGALIGVADDEYTDGQAELSCSETLILYSDGLVERRGEALDDGMERLSAAAASGPGQPSALCEHLLHSMLSAGQKPEDDVTAILATVRPDPV